MSGQQERIPTGEWRKVYSICHASIKVSLGLHKMNITLLHSGLRWRNEQKNPDKTVLHSYNDDTVLNKERQQVLR